MPGRDVTPRRPQGEDALDPEMEASAEFKRRRAKTTEDEFLAALNEDGRAVYERVLAMAKQPEMTLSWGRLAFTLSARSISDRLSFAVPRELSTSVRPVYLLGLRFIS